MQVALMSWQKMDDPTVINKIVVDGLMHGKNGDYESSVLDHARKKPYPDLVLLDTVLLTLYVSRDTYNGKCMQEFHSRLC